MMDQLSLVFFTTLAQGAVGIFIALGMVELLGKPHRTVMNKSFVAVWVLMAVAALASMTHLGQPLRMFNVLLGVSHGSPLSLEIVALTLFGVAGVAFTGMRMLNILPALQKLVLVVAMALGIVLIFAIANVYTLETVPTWNSGWTAFQFLMTAAVIGPVGAAVLLRWEADSLGSMQISADNALATSGVMALVVTVTGYVGYLFWLGQLAPAVNVFGMMDYHSSLIIGRIGWLMAGMLIWATTAMRNSNKNTPTAVVCLLMVLAAELAGRIFFYDVMISVGAGM